jgi:hypothetical protein
MVTSFGPLDMVDLVVRAETGSGSSWTDPPRPTRNGLGRA